MVTRSLPRQLMLGSDAIAAGHGVLDYYPGHTRTFNPG